MRRSSRCSFLLMSLGGAALMTSPADADQVYNYIDISSYANNNIYTDLNQNFPNTGAGTPGSHTGTPDATFVFTPWTYTPRQPPRSPPSSLPRPTRLRSATTGSAFSSTPTPSARISRKSAIPEAVPIPAPILSPQRSV
jgi:hypothetical protein